MAHQEQFTMTTSCFAPPSAATLTDHKDKPRSTTLGELLKDSDYKLTQFNSAQIRSLEEQIITKDSRGKRASLQYFYSRCGGGTIVKTWGSLRLWRGFPLIWHWHRF